MFNFQLQPFMYYPSSVSSFGVPFDQRIMSYPIIPAEPYLMPNSVNNQTIKIMEYLPLDTPRDLKLSKLDSIFGDKSNIWKSPQRIKKIKKQKSTKVDHNNVYLSFSVHKMFNFIEEIAFSDRYVRELTKKWMNTEEGIENIIKQFYQNHKKVMKFIVNSTSVRKLREVWVGEYFTKLFSDSKKTEFYTFLYRCLCKIYLQRYYCPLILRTKKLRRSTLGIHLKMRHYLLQKVRLPQSFTGYEGFN